MMVIMMKIGKRKVLMKLLILKELVILFWIFLGWLVV